MADFNVIAWVRWIWSPASPLDTQEAAILTSLARRCSAKGACYPSLATISADTKVSRRKVIQAIQALESRRLIRKKQKRRGDGFDRNHYSLKASPPDSAPDALPAQEGGARDALEVVHGVHLGSAQEHHEVTHEVTQTSNPPVGTPTTAAIKNHYLQIFREVRGRDPDWTSKEHAKHGKAFKELSQAFNGNLDVQKQVIETAMRDEFSLCMEPFAIFKRRNDFLGRPPRRKTLTASASAPQKGMADHVKAGSVDDL